MVASPILDNVVGADNVHNRQTSSSPVSTFLLYQSNLAALPQRSSFFPSSPLIDKGLMFLSPMQQDHPLQTQGWQRHPRPASAGGISRPLATTHSPTTSFSTSQSALLSFSGATAVSSSFTGLTSDPTPSIGFEYPAPATAASYPSPRCFSTETSSLQQTYLANELKTCNSIAPPAEHQLLPSPPSHDSPNSFPKYNLSVHPSPKSYLSSSNSPLTQSHLAHSDSSSRSWTPEQAEASHFTTGCSELPLTSHQVARLGSPASIEQHISFYGHHRQASPPGCRPRCLERVPSGLLRSQALAFNPSDAGREGSASLIPSRSHLYEETECFLPSPTFSPDATDLRHRFTENPQEVCSPLTPLSSDPPGLGLMNTTSGFGIPPSWFESEIFSPLDGTHAHSDYEAKSTPYSHLLPRHTPVTGGSTSQDRQALSSKCQTRVVNPTKLGPSLIPGRLMSGKADENEKSLYGHSHHAPGGSPRRTPGSHVNGCNKKKKREIREVEASCGICGEQMARLTLRGSSEELHVADGFDVVHTCKPCQEGRSGGNFASAAQALTAVPFSERSTLPEKDRFTSGRPEIFSQSAVTTFRKRNRRTDDVTAPTTCDCCARQLGIGGIVPRNGRSAIQFAVEVVCVHCVNNFRRCTDCGGGGGSRLGVGKWRCKELFADGRRTCILSHQRQGASTEVITAVWKVSQLRGNPELDTLLGQLRELVQHSLYAALATPEMLESGLARVSTFDDVKTMYLKGWKQIEPLIQQDVEGTLAKRRYVGLRWTKPHPRKGPKRIALLNNCELAPTTVRPHAPLLEPGKELSGFVLSEWDMQKGTFFVSVAMPWQSGDALESTAALAHKSFVEAKIDRELLIDELVNHGTSRREANIRYPPIRHLWTMLFFHREARLVQFLEKRRKFMPLEEYLSEYSDAHRDMFPPTRDCYVPLHEQKGWSVWVRRESGNRPSTMK